MTEREKLAKTELLYESNWPEKIEWECQELKRLWEEIAREFPLPSGYEWGWREGEIRILDEFEW